MTYRSNNIKYCASLDLEITGYVATKNAVGKTDEFITSQLLGKIIKSSEVEQKGQFHLIFRLRFRKCLTVTPEF